MGKHPIGNVNAWCWHTGAKLTLSFEVAEVVKDFRARLENRLGKKGYSVSWSDSNPETELLVQIVSIDEGNQLMRWLIPFFAPAVFEVECQLTLGGGEPESLHYVERAHFGLFGGTPRAMVSVSTHRAADKLARDFLKRMKK